MNFKFTSLVLRFTVLLLAVNMFYSPTTSAQPLTLSTFASGLNGPIGITSDLNGNLWIAEVGTGNTDGQISILTPNGNKYPFITGLPSIYVEETGEVVGPWRVYLRPGDMVAITIGGLAGTDYGASVAWVSNSGFSPGDTPLTTADITSVDHIGDYVYANGFIDSNPYAAEWDNDGNMYVADAGANAIVRVDAITGDYSVFATFPDFPNPLPFGPPFINVVPTDILAVPDGSGFYVSSLTGFPFLPGSASVFHVDWDGTVTTFFDGLTTITDMVINPITGNLMVTQLGEFSLDIFDFLPNSSMLIELLPGGGAMPVVGLLNYLTGVTFVGADIYMTSVFLGEVYALTEITTLPVTLSSFTGKAQKNGNSIQWATASETNCDFYSLQYSPDAVQFTTIATLNGAGTSSVSKNYSFTHFTPVTGNNYYRLVQTDFDGQTHVLGIINVPRNQTETNLHIRVQDNMLYASIAGIEISQPVAARIYDLGGRLLLQQTLNTANQSSFSLNLPQELNKGLYLLQLDTGNSILNGKFIW
ncbi:MAG: ScyD/ScyE family protein [Sphingobacteriales bacterium]|nr:MAG: ScyD/ScyE family protein [Sphingobacteriales bacterium]